MPYRSTPQINIPCQQQTVDFGIVEWTPEWSGDHPIWRISVIEMIWDNAIWIPQNIENDTISQFIYHLLSFASFSWVVCSCWDHKAPHQAHDVRLSKSNCHGGLLAFRNSLDLYGVRKQNVYLLFGRRPDINQIIIPPPPDTNGYWVPGCTDMSHAARLWVGCTDMLHVSLEDSLLPFLDRGECVEESAQPM